VASTPCIYGVGAFETCTAMRLEIASGQVVIRIAAVTPEPITSQCRRSDKFLRHSCFRPCGDRLEIWQAHLEDRVRRIAFFHRKRDASSPGMTRRQPSSSADSPDTSA